VTPNLGTGTAALYMFVCFPIFSVVMQHKEIPSEEEKDKALGGKMDEVQGNTVSSLTQMLFPSHDF
jgi:hypothetical protein